MPSQRIPCPVGDCEHSCAIQSGVLAGYLNLAHLDVSNAELDTQKHKYKKLYSSIQVSTLQKSIPSNTLTTFVMPDIGPLICKLFSIAEGSMNALEPGSRYTSGVDLTAPHIGPTFYAAGIGSLICKILSRAEGLISVVEPGLTREFQSYGEFGSEVALRKLQSSGSSTKVISHNKANAPNTAITFFMPEVGSLICTFLSIAEGLIAVLEPGSRYVLGKAFKSPRVATTSTYTAEDFSYA